MLLQTNDEQFITLSDQEIKAKFGFNHTNNIVLEDGTTPVKPLHTSTNPAIQQALYLRYVGPPVGYAVFTQEAIPSDTILCIYSGKLYKETNAYLDSRYRQCLSNNYIVDSKYYGNISRFISHFPTEDELNDYQFTSPEIKQIIATENAEPRTLEYQLDNETFDANAIVTTVALEKGQQIGMSYQYDYWLDFKEFPVLFDKETGQIIHTGYQHNLQE